MSELVQFTLPVIKEFLGKLAGRIAGIYATDIGVGSLKITLQGLLGLVTYFAQNSMLSVRLFPTMYNLLRTAFDEAGYLQVFQQVARQAFGTIAGIEKGIESQCASCGKEPVAICGRCTTTMYCGDKCQQRHWKTHKHECTK